MRGWLTDLPCAVLNRHILFCFVFATIISPTKDTQMRYAVGTVGATCNQSRRPFPKTEGYFLHSFFVCASQFACLQRTLIAS